VSRYGLGAVGLMLLTAGSVSAAEAPIRPLRLGIAGLTHSHVHGILGRAKADVEVVGVAEGNQTLAERYAERYGLDRTRIFPSLEAMIEGAHPEAVAAFGSTVEHRAVVEACAPRGIPVMVEKPLAFELADALAMQELARRYHVPVLTNLETTWYPSVHAVQRLVNAEGAVGDVRRIVVRDGHRGPKEIGVDPEFLEWLTDPVRNGGGALTDFGCYGANLVTWLMGGEAPLAVTAVTQQIKPDVYPRVDDEATVVLTYPRAVAILEASWNWPVSRKDLDVYGDRGYVLAPDRATVRLRREEGEPEEMRSLEPRPAPFDDPFSHLAAVVHGEIAVSDEDLSSLANGVAVARILDAARESARTGRTVVLADEPRLSSGAVSSLTAPVPAGDHRPGRHTESSGR
jgi:predicted dehydrogenase